MEHDHNVEDQNQVSMILDDYETTSYDTDSDSSSSKHVLTKSFECFLARNGMVRLEAENTSNEEYGIIKRSFLSGMGLLHDGIAIVALHKNSYSSVVGKAKLETFRIFVKAVAENRGDGNVKYAWYGGCRDDIRDVIGHGFGRFGEVGGDCGGVGVHLSPANVPICSALKAEEDENGVRHMLLCRVILGKTETIPAGSRQSHPSSTDFDSGIDNPMSPRKYIIWAPYMNSHIFPNYIISFRGSAGTSSSSTGLYSPRMKLPVLLNVLSRLLEPSKMGSILKRYNDFRENKIQRSQLIEGLRNLVGDKTLVSVLKLCRDI